MFLGWAWCIPAALAADTAPAEPTRGNLEHILNQAATAKRDPLLTLDRPLYDALQAAKHETDTKVGLNWALEYSTIYQATSGGIDPRQAMEGTTDLSAMWKFLREPNKVDAAGVGFLGESRTNYTSDTFVDVRRGLGSLWSPNDSTSDDYYQIKQFWWGQTLGKGAWTYQVGLIDPGAYINANRFAGNDKVSFFSQPFATNPAKVFPQNGLGAQGRYKPVDWLYFQGVVSNADANSGYNPFKTLNGHGFVAGEIGLTPKAGTLGEGNYRVMAWNNPTNAGRAAGISLSLDQNLGETLGVFARFGWNNGELDDVEQFAAGGISFLQPFGRANDQAGVGISWTSPSDHMLRDEYSSEVFYRLQLTHGIEVSGSAQLIVNPSAGDEDCAGVFGIRLRVLY